MAVTVKVTGDVEGIGEGQRPWDAVTDVTWPRLQRPIGVDWDNPEWNKWDAEEGTWATVDGTSADDGVAKGHWKVVT